MTKQIKVNEATHTELINYKKNNECKSIDDVITELLQNPIIKQRFEIVNNSITDKSKPLTLNQTVSLLNEQNKEIIRLEHRLHEVLSELYCKDRKLEELGVDISCCDK